MRRRQVFAAASNLTNPQAWSALAGQIKDDFADALAIAPGDDALPEPRRKPGWPKGRKRK